MSTQPPGSSGSRPGDDTPFGGVDPDLDIVRLAQARQTRRVALGILYERFRDRVYNTALRVVGDREDAADVMQEVFILLFRNIRRFRARANFASWVYRITINASLDQLRRRRRTPTPGVPAVLLDAPSEVPDLSAPERNLAQLDLSEHVRDAMSRLSDRLRIVVVLRYLEGLSYSDIAEILDVSLGTVKSRLNRAHAALRDELGSRYDSGSARA